MGKGYVKKILLIYESSRGSAAQAAEWIAEELPDVTMVNVRDEPLPEYAAEYDTIILGTGIVAGQAYKQTRKLLKKQRDLLLAKELFLFITHLEDGEGIELDFQSAFDEEILEHAAYRKGVGGWLNIKKVNIFARPIMHMIAKDKGIDIHNHDNLNREACKELAQAVLAG